MRPILIFVLLAAAISSPAQGPYGVGTPGSAGLTPSLSSGQAWLGNTAFGFTIAEGLGGAGGVIGFSTAPGTLFSGPLQILISVQPSDLFLLAPVALGGAPGVPGAGSTFLPFPLALPPLPALAGITFYTQAVIDQGVGVPFAATQGLEVELVMPPQVFVGTSVGGSADPTYFIDPVAQTLLWQFSSGANNVTDAEYAHSGKRLYVATGLGNSVREVNLETSPPTWSTFYPASGSCYGVAVDDARKILYSFAGSGTAAELVAVNADLSSGSYGQLLGSTTGLGATNGWVERWELSPNGLYAAALTVFSPQLILIDTDPMSANYLQHSLLGPVPTAPSPLPLAITPKFTPGNEQILITVSAGGGPGEIARFDLILGTWIDHDLGTPGVQNIGPLSVPYAQVPSSPWELDIARDGSFAVMSGWANGGSVGRVDLDLSNPAVWNYTLLSSNHPGAWACALSGEGTMIAVGEFGGGSSQVSFLDAMTGIPLGTVPIPGASNVYTVKFH